MLCSSSSSCCRFLRILSSKKAFSAAKVEPKDRLYLAEWAALTDFRVSMGGVLVGHW